MPFCPVIIVLWSASASVTKMHTQLALFILFFFFLGNSKQLLTEKCSNQYVFSTMHLNCISKVLDTPHIFFLYVIILSEVLLCSVLLLNICV